MSSTNVTYLQDLSVLLSDYSELLTRHQALSPEVRESLRTAYDLQSKVSTKLHDVLSHESALEQSRNTEVEDALWNLRHEVRRFQDVSHRRVLPQPWNRQLVDEFSRVLTILGPNEGFPDDPKTGGAAN